MSEQGWQSYCRRCGGMEFHEDAEGNEIPIPRDEQCDCFKVTCPHCGEEFDR